MPFRETSSKELSDLLVAMADNVGSAMWAVDKSLRLTWANPHLKQALGVAFATCETWLPLYRRAFETKQTVHADESFEWGGSHRHFSISVFPVSDHLAVLVRET